MTLHQEKFEQIAEQVAAWRGELGVPGVTFGVYVGGEIYAGGNGVTSIENPLPVNDETIFQIGSITKTVTAALMLRLVDQGLLDLDARVRTYLPQFRVRDEEVSERVKVWHLLTHRAGWTGDIFTDTGGGADAAARYVDGMADFEQLAPLGLHFSYNNASFCVAGRIIEALTGATYEEALWELIFEPLGMERSFLIPDQVMLHRFAVGHQATKDGYRVLSPWAIPRGMNAAGGICCHIHDLLRYGAYHLDDGPPLLRPESLAEMHKRQTPSLPYLGWCGLAWMISGEARDTRLWHTGGTNGQNAILTVVPEHQLALGMMTNGDKGPALYDRFNKAVLREYCGIVIAEPRAIESSAEELAQYVGRYLGTMWEIHLRMDEGRLLADFRYHGGFPSDGDSADMPPAEVARCGPDQLLALNGAFEGRRVDFLRDEAGRIRYMRFGSRLTVRQA